MIEILRTIPRCILAGLMSGSLLVCANPLLAAERADSGAQNRSEADLLAVGAIETIDLSSGFVLVAGQRVLVSRDTVLIENESAISSGAGALRLLHAGDFVAVNGLLERAAASISRLPESYVPGATSVFVRGRVSRVDDSNGVATVGGLKIDFTP